MFLLTIVKSLNLTRKSGPSMQKEKPSLNNVKKYLQLVHIFICFFLSKIYSDLYWSALSSVCHCDFEQRFYALLVSV
jgi:hypothetical protein